MLNFLPEPASAPLSRHQFWSSVYVVLLSRGSPDEAAVGADRALALFDHRWGTSLPHPSSTSNTDICG